MTYNQITLVGNLGKDPEIRPVGENKVATFSIATSENKKDAQGNWVEDSKWWDIRVFGRTVDTVESHCVKGTQVLVTGRMTYRDWQDNNGNNRRSYEVLADRVVLLSRTKNEQLQQGISQQLQAQAQPVQQAQQAQPEAVQGDLPF